MNRDALVEFFDATGLASHQAAGKIAEQFTSIALKKNEYLLKAGTVADRYLFLEAGFMRTFSYDLDGNEITTGFYQPGEMLFEVASFFNRTRSKEYIQAISDCEGWFITYQQLNELFHALPEFREFGRAALVKGFSELKNRMLSTITETAEDRYRDLLRTHPVLFQHASLKHIATYLGVTDSSLSRIRAGLVKK